MNSSFCAPIDVNAVVTRFRMAYKFQAVRKVLYKLSIERFSNSCSFVASIDRSDVIVLAGSASLNEVVSRA